MALDATGISIMTNGLYTGPNAGTAHDIQTTTEVIHTHG